MRHKNTAVAYTGAVPQAIPFKYTEADTYYVSNHCVRVTLIKAFVIKYIPT